VLKISQCLTEYYSVNCIGGFMALAIVYTRASIGMEAPLVTVEAHISNGLPGLTLVGLPETAVKESRDRVRSALLNSGFEYPAKK
jgi:magnesium chelatase family protein